MVISLNRVCFRLPVGKLPGEINTWFINKKLNKKVIEPEEVAFYYLVNMETAPMKGDNTSHKTSNEMAPFLKKLGIQSPHDFVSMKDRETVFGKILNKVSELVDVSIQK